MLSDSDHGFNFTVDRRRTANALGASSASVAKRRGSRVYSHIAHARHPACARTMGTHKLFVERPRAFALSLDTSPAPPDPHWCRGTTPGSLFCHCAGAAATGRARRPTPGGARG